MESLALLGKIASLPVRAPLGMFWVLLAVAVLGEMLFACGGPRRQCVEYNCAIARMKAIV